MRFVIYTNIAFEEWDWRNSIDGGIGGCETSITEMSHRLVSRGHEVVIYAPIPKDCPQEWRGTVWKRLEDVDFSEPGVWVLYRCPEKLDEFDTSRTDQPKWLICQDWDYPNWTPERVARCDRIVPICRAHETWLLNRHPEFAGKTWVTRNGVKPELIEEVEQTGDCKVCHGRGLVEWNGYSDPEGWPDDSDACGECCGTGGGKPVRNPHRIMFASSPDRGLLHALKIFKRVKEYIPDAELHATYGFNNIDKLIAQGATHFQAYKDECMRLVEETGAVFHGRLTQRELYREWLKTGILVYATTFWETGWITGIEAQALGAIPVFSPIWAQGENTRHGYAVPGNPDDPLTQSRFVQAVVGLMQQPERQEQMRGPMMADVRANWSWEQFVWQKPGENWEQAAEEDLGVRSKHYSFSAEVSERERYLRLKPGDVFIDAGSGAGSWSLPAARQGARVLAIDPIIDSDTLESLSRAEQLPIVIARQFLADRVGAVFEVKGGDGKTAQYKATTIDALVEQMGFDRVDMLKVDVEGFECAVLDGARGVLSRFAPDLFIEVHTQFGVNLGDVTSRLEEFGYQCEVLPRTHEGYEYCFVAAQVPCGVSAEEELALT